MSHPDTIVARELLNGFSNGFRLNYTGPHIHSMSKNLVSAEQFSNETLAKIQNEVNLGRMLGPFKYLSISTLRISPIGLVPKSDGNWRLITHLSYPQDGSVNSFINPELCNVSFSSFDNILDKIYECGNGTEHAKVDIKSAFRLLIVNPSDFELLGIYFVGKFYIDKCLPMECAISCSLFEKFSTFLQWAVEEACGLHSVDHYLDDFLFVGQKDTNNYLTLMNTFKHICGDLGVLIADNKTMGPAEVIHFLGFTIDTVLMMVRIPEEKLHKLSVSLKNLLQRKKVFLKDLESFIGLLAYCSRAIPSSRAFITRFYDLIASVKVKKPYYMIRINKEVKGDVLIWLIFFRQFQWPVLFSRKSLVVE